MISIRRPAALKRTVGIVVALLCCATETRAAIITDLYNTGVNNLTAMLGPNVIDPHYLITFSPSGPTLPRTVIDTAFPFPPWVPNSPGVGGSRWIAPEANGNGLPGNYRYRTMFTVPANANLSTVNVSGLWGTDDPSIAMRINGNLTPNVSGGFTTLVPFNITSGFVIGNNVLTFDLTNVVSVTGLRVDRAIGTYQLIPEPATAGLVCLGCLAFAAVQRRRRRSFFLGSHIGRSRMNCHRQISVLSTCLAFVSLAGYMAASAQADPLVGRDLLKFSQLPMIATPVPDTTGVVTTYGGHDELSTAYGFSNAAQPPQDYSGRFMADDFADKLSSPVVHVKWWGSYHNDFIDPQMPVNKFLISFESDMPAGPAPSFSRPDQPLLNQVVTRAAALSPGSGTFTEKLIRGPDPVVNESLYEYNAELHLGKDFPELKDQVYWLKIVAMVDVTPGITFPTNMPPSSVTQWGWHNRDYTQQNSLASPNVSPGEQVVGTVGANVPVWHFQDDAVTGDVRILPGPNGFIMPQVIQPVASMFPTNYLDLADGPGPSGIPGTTNIGQFSKDLAFELYTVVPEPTSGLLLVIGMAGFVARRRSALR